MSKASNPLLFLPIEIKVREFHGKLLFSLFAAERGFDVILGGQPHLWEKLESLPRGLYLDKSVAITKNSWFSRFREMGNMVAAWDEEGLIFLDADIYKKNRLSREAIAQTERVFAWGDVQAKVLKEYAPEHAQKIIVTGNPRFDLLRPEFREFYRVKAEDIRKRHGPFILINTNFGHYNHFRGLDEGRKILEHYPVSSERDFLDGWLAFQEEGFNGFVSLAATLSRAYRDHTVVVRPSPSENRQTWTEQTRNLANVRIESGGNVLEWIMASEAVIHFNCTTGIESFLLDVPAIAYRCVRDEKFEPELPNAMTLQAFSETDVLDHLNRIRDGASPYPQDFAAEARAVARPYLKGTEGAFSSDNIIDELVTIDLPPPLRAQGRNAAVPLHKRAWRRVLSAVRRKDKIAAGYSRQKFPGLTLEEVQESVALFRDVSGRFGSLEVQNLGSHCFLVRSGGASSPE